MLELQRLGVQRLALEATQFGDQLLAGALGQLQRAAVQRVADDGVLQVRHVYADLMGAAGLQAAFQGRMGAEALAQPVVGDGVAAVLAHRHAQAVARMAVDRRVGGAAGDQGPDHHRQILPVHVARGQLRHQRGVRLQGPRHHHGAAGVLVQAVHDAGARQRRQPRIAVQQGIDQGAAGIAGARVHHQPGRLVQHDDLVVLVQHLQRDVLGQGVGLGVQHRVQAGDLAAAQRIARPRRGAVEQGVAGFDPFGQARTRVFGEQFGQHRVEAATGGVIGDARLARAVADGVLGEIRGGMGHGRGTAWVGKRGSRRP
ncbi:hypothetical protein NB713_002821 [Xanthomonas sacchari]|nr:hypothetical protein [Xanthomonas sacchari]